VNYYEKYEENKDCEEILGVSYQSFIPLLIKVVQDQQKEIEELKQQKEFISDKLDTITSLINDSSATIPISDSQQNPLLYSDSISSLKQTV